MLGISLTPAYASPEKTWGVCTVPPIDTTKNFQLNTKLVTGATYLEADTGSINANGVSVLEGAVDIRHDDQHLQADSASYDRPDDKLTASGNIVFSTKTLSLDSSKIEYKLKERSGKIHDAEYNLKSGMGHGSSNLVTLTGNSQTKLKDATFSTCPASQKSWHIASSNIRLDHDSQIGKARNVTFKVGDVPVFYSPYFSFPLNNQRRSGFLAPSFGITDQLGTKISLPYYINFAPNHDATLTPTILTKRGLKLDSEFRYLTDNDNGIINIDILPSDNERNEDNRSLVSIKHKTKFTEHTTLSINASDVSDTEYFDDFGDSLVTTSTPALERRIDLTTLGKNWSFNTSLQDYQILDSEDAPYSRLPELKFSYIPTKKMGKLNMEFETELVNFDKDSETTGIRFDISAGASKRYGDASWFITPALQVRHTEYSLNNNTTSNNDTPSRTLPTISLDTGLFFDKNLEGHHKIQTLEPRLFYTYTPFKDQNNIPVFDAATNSFSTSTRLFSQNRFTGKDRIGDTNQLTTALTTRLIDTKIGKEVLSASIGQIHYFDDRKVTLPGTPVETSRSSEFAFEFAGRLNTNTRLINSFYWDPDLQRTSSSEARIHYKDQKKRVANLSYRRLDQELEQAAFSFSTPINHQWGIIGKTEYDLLKDRNLETLVGIEYSSCCWKTRIGARRFMTSDNINYDNNFFIEFELKGLGSLGVGNTNILEEQIYGYEK